MVSFDHKTDCNLFYFALQSQAEVEETMKRIQSHKGVVGTIVVNSEGFY